ncbi:hypothetical protein GSI_04772 [Ganoderma sinense ZZ0214-1]|uniref:Uncharacterized protein n=1 Tax=Ganoderma sinense ZZ0214-1 TaxID=1077348 RepID=A0A2G8SHU3_9APHY|nr:hypothetical protein GSI_04772 [Ganoderma sinense ZZ0214-1]
MRAVLASLVRVLDDALSRLKIYYTNDLAAWQDPDARARYVAARDADAPTGILLALITNTLSLLPAAFLVCTELMTAYCTYTDRPYQYPAACFSVLDRYQPGQARGALERQDDARGLAPMTEKLMWSRRHRRLLCQR